MSSQLKGTLLIITGTVLWGASGVLSQHLFVDKMISAEWLVTIRLILSGIIYYVSMQYFTMEIFFPFANKR